MSRPPKAVSDYMAEIGSKGGKKRGKSKKRGDSSYYAEIVRKRWAKKKAKE